MAGDGSHREQSVVIAAPEDAIAAMNIRGVLGTEDLAGRRGRARR